MQKVCSNKINKTNYQEFRKERKTQNAIVGDSRYRENNTPKILRKILQRRRRLLKQIEKKKKN